MLGRHRRDTLWRLTPKRQPNRGVVPRGICASIRARHLVPSDKLSRYVIEENQSTGEEQPRRGDQVVDKWREDRVRERAFEIWEQAGRPDGNSTAHWLHAEAEIDAVQLAALEHACDREIRSCFRLAAALSLWRRRRLDYQMVALVAAIVFGGVAVLQVLIRFGDTRADVAAGLLILAAVWSIVMYVIGTIGPSSTDLENSAAEFFSLHNHFQRIADLGRVGLVDDFAQEFTRLLNRKDAARQAAPAVPKKYVQAARNAAPTEFDDGGN
jgi:hypothetical protein